MINYQIQQKNIWDWGSQQQNNLGGLSGRRIWGISTAEEYIWDWGSQQQKNLRVSAAEQSGGSAAEETGDLRRIWGLSCRIIWGSQQQKNMGLGV